MAARRAGEKGTAPRVHSCHDVETGDGFRVVLFQVQDAVSEMYNPNYGPQAPGTPD